jgi:hypothetical protein
VKIPRWRIALTGAALTVLTIAGIGLAQAAAPPAADPALAAPEAAVTADPAAGGATRADLRLRPLRNVVHGTITFNHPDEGLITVQVDGGTITAVDADSMTIAEAGGASVTVAIDDQTRVRLDKKRSTAASLKAGQTVRVISRIGTGNAATARLIAASAGG